MNDYTNKKLRGNVVPVVLLGISIIAAIGLLVFALTRKPGKAQNQSELPSAKQQRIEQIIETTPALSTSVAPSKTAQQKDTSDTQLDKDMTALDVKLKAVGTESTNVSTNMNVTQGDLSE